MLRAITLAFMSWALLATAANSAKLPPGYVYLRHVAPDILQDMRYAGPDNFTGQRVPGYEAAECILVRAVAEALKKAQGELRDQSLSLKVYDCYRPTRATVAFLRWIGGQSGQINARFHPGVDRAKLRTLGYISGSSMHSRGLAVDVTLVRIPTPTQAAFDHGTKYGPCNGIAHERSPDNSIDMGTAFDCFDGMAHARSSLVTPEQRQARAHLRTVMSKHGFHAYDREWWHFTFGGGRSTHPTLDFAIQVAP